MTDKKKTVIAILGGLTTDVDSIPKGDKEQVTVTVGFIRDIMKEIVDD